MEDWVKDWRQLYAGGGRAGAPLFEWPAYGGAWSPFAGARAAGFALPAVGQTWGRTPFGWPVYPTGVLGSPAGTPLAGAQAGGQGAGLGAGAIGTGWGLGVPAWPPGPGLGGAQAAGAVGGGAVGGGPVIGSVQGPGSAGALSGGPGNWAPPPPTGAAAAAPPEPPGGGQAPSGSPAPPGISQQWWDAFAKEHGGQTPIDYYGGTGEGMAEALADLEWSKGFEQMYGRPPTDDDWRAWWFQTRAGGEPWGDEESRRRLSRIAERWEKALERWQELQNKQRAPLWIPPEVYWR